MEELSNIENILSSFLGDSKNGLSYSSQIQYCCPYCSENDGVDYDGRYNLEINIIKNRYRCWKCEHESGMSGKIQELITKYGGESTLAKYREEIINIRNSKMYEFKYLSNDIDLVDSEYIISLPDGYKEFMFDGNPSEKKALDYLTSRGITRTLIEKYSIKYTDYSARKFQFRNRIIIPSYDKYKALNYFSARDYSEKSKYKYSNEESVKVKDILFNEKLINWDGDITIVEGVFDHIAIPNSIPILGKALNKEFYVYKLIIKNPKANIIIFLDDDAERDVENICKLLYNIDLHDRIKVVPTKKLLNIINKTKKLGLKKLDPSKLYELYGKKGVIWAIKSAETYKPDFL